jgi:saccharopine dehydrogenase-like NADP-dependent oxidoreductase
MAPIVSFAALKNVLVIGAGKSSGVLIAYLLDEAAKHDWRVRVADRDGDLAARRVAGHPRGEAFAFDAGDAAAIPPMCQSADLVVSLLPATMHGPVAEACAHQGTHFVCASYVAPEIRALHETAERRGVTLLCEMGVDPGIDHMSAMERLDALRSSNARIAAFETFTGGLVAPESDDNPWNYKFTWNPRNVVLAGQGGVKFKHNGRYKYIPYHKLFSRYEILEVPGYGKFEGYPNRDSLRYRAHYDLFDVDTIYRGTLRRPGFCQAWDCLVQLGVTDDSYQLEELDGMTYREFVNAYLWWDEDMSVELKLRAMLKLEMNSPAFDRLEWLGLFEKRPIGLRSGTPAQVLQKLLEDKWAMRPDDKDMIVMLHKFEYELGGERWREQSSMVTLGSDGDRTAMAKTVGLASGIGAKLVLTDVITKRGVVIPTGEHVYAPMLDELRQHGIAFEEQVQRV